MQRDDRGKSGNVGTHDRNGGTANSENMKGRNAMTHPKTGRGCGIEWIYAVGNVRDDERELLEAHAT